MFKAPPVQLICPRDLTFSYVPGHLSHILFELLKNSLRAIVERYGVDPSAETGSVSAPGGMFPPIKVIVVEGNEDITIKISDEGGGIPRSAIPLVWTYMYTTMDVEAQGGSGSVRGAGSMRGGSPGSALENLQSAANDFAAPMAGFGYGLPLSRLVSCVSCFLFALVYNSILTVCTVLWRRPKVNIHGRIWDGCIHPSQQTLEQSRATAMKRGSLSVRV